MFLRSLHFFCGHEGINKLLSVGRSAVSTGLLPPNYGFLGNPNLRCDCSRFGYQRWLGCWRAHRKGLKVLLLERGRNIEQPSSDYGTRWKHAVGDPFIGAALTVAARAAHAVLRRRCLERGQSGLLGQRSFDSPYVEVKPSRLASAAITPAAARLGMWGRQSYRWSDLDFAANAKVGSVPWTRRSATPKSRPGTITSRNSRASA